MSERKSYHRVILKISGESLCTPGGWGIDRERIESVAALIASAAGADRQLGVVVGAGNLVRGRHLADISAIEPATADHMGMLATVMNAVALRDALVAAGRPASALSAVPVGGICEAFSRRRAIELLEAGQVVVFGGGTGSPFVTTDMAAALRACEVSAEAVFKATKVDGVYDSDPETHPDAVRYEHLGYRQVLQDRLGVMDLAAVGMCMEKSVPVLVFRLDAEGRLDAALRGEPVGTLVSD
jgi:uridylate kinase